MIPIFSNILFWLIIVWIVAFRASSLVIDTGVSDKGAVVSTKARSLRVACFLQKPSNSRAIMKGDEHMELSQVSADKMAARSGALHWLMAPVLALALGVSGCVQSASEISGTPVTPEVMRGDMAAARGWLFDREEGFWFEPDGTAFWISRGSRMIVTRSTVASAEGRGLCVAPQGSWTGSCLQVFETDSGYLCRVEFGNGRGRTESCAPTTTRWFNA